MLIEYTGLTERVRNYANILWEENERSTGNICSSENEYLRVEYLGDMNEYGARNI